ncbi:MAG: S41 family peptidase [Pseudomonadota bacterium]
MKARNTVIRTAAIVAAATVCFLFTSPRAFALSPLKSVSAEDVRSDLKHLRRLLLLAHPNLYAHKSQEKLSAEFSAIEARVKGGMKMGEAMLRVQQMLAAVCDEHTQIDLSETYDELDPKIFRIIGEPIISSPGLILFDHWNMKRSPTKLVALQGIPAADIDREMRATISADGCKSDSAILNQLEPLDTTLLLSFAIAQRSEYSATVRTRISTNPDVYGPPERRAVRLRPIGEIRWERRNTAANYRHTPLEDIGFKLPRAGVFNTSDPKNHGIMSATSEDGRYAYIHMGSFTKSADQTKTMNRVMRKIIRGNPKHVILDLTESPGGWIRSARRLLSYFLPRAHNTAKTLYKSSLKAPAADGFTPYSKERGNLQRTNARDFVNGRYSNGNYVLKAARASFGNPHYRGKITVLVGPNTFSAATMVALALKKERGATIVGHLSGGDNHTTCYAAHGTYRLPATGIRVAIPETCYTRSSSNGKGSRRPVPDVKVDPFGQLSSQLKRAIIQAAANHIAGRKESAAKNN